MHVQRAVNSLSSWCKFIVYRAFIAEKRNENQFCFVFGMTYFLWSRRGRWVLILTTTSLVFAQHLIWTTFEQLPFGQHLTTSSLDDDNSGFVSVNPGLVTSNDCLKGSLCSFHNIRSQSTFEFSIHPRSAAAVQTF